MSSSYSCLDWVSSHWAHSLCLDSFVFMFVFLCLSCHTAYLLYYCNTVGWTWWDLSVILSTFLQCFDTVGWVMWPVKTCPQYDLYNVFGGTLNLTQPTICLSVCLSVFLEYSICVTSYHCIPSTVVCVVRDSLTRILNCRQNLHLHHTSTGTAIM